MGSDRYVHIGDRTLLDGTQWEVSVVICFLDFKSNKCIGHVIGHAQRYQSILSIVINIDSEVLGSGRVGGDFVVFVQGG